MGNLITLLPVLVKVQWDGFTDFLRLPLDYYKLSTLDKLSIPLDQLKTFLPREFIGLPDWAYDRILHASMFPGFSPNLDQTGEGTGVEVYTLAFVTSGAT